MAAWRQLGFDITGNSAIRSADPENPTVEPNMKCKTIYAHTKGRSASAAVRVFLVQV